MNTEIEKILNSIINPESGKTLKEEGRIVKLQMQEDVLIFQYKRDGITPMQKRAIEKDIFNRISGKIAEDKIKILTISDRSQDVFNSLGGSVEAPKKQEPADKPADLKVGHGTIGEKKRVAGIKNIIAVGSGKGGVGKSTVTANLAVALAKQGKKVGVIDADIYGPSMPIMFGLRGKRPVSNSNKKIVPMEAHGIKMMSFGFFIEENDPVIWRGPMLGGVINQFLFDVAWGELDYLLLDLPPGTGDVQLSMVQNVVVDGCVIVSTPQDVALHDAIKGLLMFKKLEIPVVGLVENMSYFVCNSCDEKHFIFGESKMNEIATKLETGLLVQIPMESVIRKNSDEGRPFMCDEGLSSSASYLAYTDLASKLEHKFGQQGKPGGDEPKEKGLFSKLFGKS